jgi:hypothetical protein
VQSALAAQYTRPFLYPKQERAIFSPKRWATVEASTKSGKTIGCIAWILEQCLQGGANHNYWWVAPAYPQSEIAYRRIKAGLTKGSFVPHDTPIPRIDLMNGSVLWFKSGDNPDALFGEDVYAAVVDEASRVKAESWYALRSTLTATGGPARLIGNVKGRKNWFYEMCRRIERGQEPNGSYERITVQDAIDAGVIPSEEVEDARRNLPEHIFRELYEALPSDDGGNPFGEDHIYACVADRISTKPPVAFGIDLAKKHDWLVVIGLDDTGRVARFERWQGWPWRKSIARIWDIVGEDIPALYDSTGIGDPVGEELEADGHGNFTGFTFGPTSKQRLMEGLAVSIQSHEIAYPDGPIKEELLAFEYQLPQNGGRTVRYAAAEGWNDDCVCSLALAREQWSTTAPGASLISFYASQTKKARADAAVDPGDLPEAEDDFVRRFTHADAAATLDNELTELYTKTMAEYDAPTTHQCARCGMAVHTTNRVTDGFNVWHPECIGFGA